jgi:hypothetical protein
MEKCFDEGMIQAFLDGEMASDLSEKVACHVAMCDNCATALAFAEEESCFAFAALDAELNALVPTERIRTRLFASIATEQKSVWQKIFGEGFRWTNPSIAAFASLLLVVGLFTTLWIARENSLSDNRMATVEAPPVKSVQIAPVAAGDDEKAPGNLTPPQADNPGGDEIVQRATAKPRTENRFEAQKAVYTPVNVPNVKNTLPKVENLLREERISGEQSYLKTIATLKQTVDNRKDELMKPSTRVAFEKDMAVVNDAIRKMQREVRKNPKNEAAKEVLRSSYQNKIDLLNSVAEKNELMASFNKGY